MEPVQSSADLSSLIRTYNELNPSTIEELNSEPTPLEFMRFVAKNTPFVARGAAKDWRATKTWTRYTLEQKLGSQTVNVAVTPDGRADAPARLPDGTIVFAQPHVESQPFSEFMTFSVDHTGGGGEVRYAQSQNDNVRDEYQPLLPDIQRDIPFARIALQRRPDAVNLWIGTTRSVTAMHRDNYENIYVQILGRKHFVLLPALCQPCVNERFLPQATYVRGLADTLHLVLDVPPKSVPFPLWDVDAPLANTTRYSALAEPVRVTLEPGDMLYLPSMWYHKVSQSCAEGEIVVAANYWYDMEFSGPLYPLCDMIRNMTLAGQPEGPPEAAKMAGNDNESLEDGQQQAGGGSTCRQVVCGQVAGGR